MPLLAVGHVDSNANQKSAAVHRQLSHRPETPVLQNLEEGFVRVTKGTSSNQRVQEKEKWGSKLFEGSLTFFLASAIFSEKFDLYSKEI